MNKKDREKLENTSSVVEENNYNNTNNKQENNINDNSGKNKRLSKTLRSSLKMKKKEKKNQRKSSCDAISDSKKVKINDKVHIIDVECWKKYNLEQTADENYEEFVKMELENKKNEENGNKNDKNNKNNKNNAKRVKGKNGNVSCTCIII